MHGRGKMATALASDAVTRTGRRCLHVEPRLVFFFFFRFRIRADSALTCAELGRFALIWIVSAEYWCVSAGKRKSADKKKKKF